MQTLTTTDTAAAPAAPQETTAGAFEALSRTIKEKGLRFAEFWFTDLSGRPWRITMPTDALTEELFTSGLPLDGQPVGGAWEGVMQLLPRYDALYPDPTAAVPSLVMFCDVLDPKTKEPLALEPRHVLKRAVRLAGERLGAIVNIGAEPEFMLLDAKGRPAPETAVWDFLRTLAVALGDAGVRVDWFRTGPAIGQGRVQMRAGAPLQLADRVLLYRHMAMNLARKSGFTCSFLPRPSAAEGTPGFPLHLALWKDGVNLFHDDSGWSLTSPLARGFAGGLLAHLPALLGLCAPTPNSYRRLIPGVRGAVEPVLSTSLKTAACRIPARSTVPGARRVKFCAPDSTANPYLAFAAVIAAGLDGADKKLVPSVDGEERAGRRLPHCLESALEALDSDREFLTSAGVFTDGHIDAWIAERWEKHILPVRAVPHPVELASQEQFGRVVYHD